MLRVERLSRLRRLLGERRPLSVSWLMAELEVSRATLNRDLQDLRTRFNCPVVYDRENGGYRIDPATATFASQIELPGLWFSAEEIHALLTVQHLLSNLGDGGMLAPLIRPLLAPLARVLGAHDDKAQEVARRIRIQTVGARRFRLESFQSVGSAVLRRKRLLIDYHARSRDETLLREVSPQRLIHYRDNWYLDAWCHLRNGLRSFSVDAIQRAEILDRTAQEIDDATLDRVLGSGYGIFSGADVIWAKLRFSPSRSRWVAHEQWHPDQRSCVLDDGSFELAIPYSDTPELLMDILRHGSHVEVVSPPELREAVRREHLRAANYFSPVSGIETGGRENDFAPLGGDG